MTTHYSSKHGLVARRPEELYMVFCDMRNFSKLVPGKVEAEVSADYDNLCVTVQGFKIGVRVDDREPYRLISVEIDANLNLMMRSLLGSKIQQGLDKMVDGLVAVSEGRMPDIPEEFRR